MSHGFVISNSVHCQVRPTGFMHNEGRRLEGNEGAPRVMKRWILLGAGMTVVTLGICLQQWMRAQEVQYPVPELAPMTAGHVHWGAGRYVEYAGGGSPLDPQCAARRNARTCRDCRSDARLPHRRFGN